MSARLEDLRELVVDGVRVFHLPRPGKTRALLHVGVGLQDETYETVGLTHLVEHLAMAQVDSGFLDVASGVGVAHTVFSAYGSAAAVGEHLRQICTALADVSLERLDHVKAALAAEGTAGADLTAAAAWAARYGLVGPGLAVTDGHGPWVLTGEEVLAHAAAHFTAGRAALAVLGPLPEGLSLPLRPDAPRPAGKASGRLPATRAVEGPAWVDASSPGVGLLLDGFDVDDDAARVAAMTLCERLRDVARGERGLTYSVSVEPLPGPEGDTHTLVLDHRGGSADEVAGLVWEQLTDLAVHGPTRAELDHVLAGYAASADTSDEDVVEEEPFRLASAAVLDTGDRRYRTRTLADSQAAVARTTRDDVRDRLASASRRALLVVPEGTDLPDSAQRVAPIAQRPWCAVAEHLPPGRVVRPPALRRLTDRYARITLVLSDDCLALQDQDGVVHVVRWDDVVGVREIVPLPEVEGVVVIGRDRCGIPVHPSTFGREAHAEVLRRLAPHVERLRQAKQAWERSVRAAEAGA